MINRDFTTTVRASDFFDEVVIQQHTLVAATEYIFDLGGFYNRIKISIDCTDQGAAPIHILFGGAIAVTALNGYFIFTNSNQEFEISARYIRVISAGTPDVSVMGLR